MRKHILFTIILSLFFNIYILKRLNLIEVGIPNQDLFQTVEVDKTRKYDLLANELAQHYKCKTKIIPYVIAWDGLATTYHDKYLKELGVTKSFEAYMQSVVLKKTLSSISFEFRREIVKDSDEEVVLIATRERLAITEA